MYHLRRRKLPNVQSKTARSFFVDTFFEMCFFNLPFNFRFRRIFHSSKDRLSIGKSVI